MSEQSNPSEIEYLNYPCPQCDRQGFQTTDHENLDWFYCQCGYKQAWEHYEQSNKPKTDKEVKQND